MSSVQVIGPTTGWVRLGLGELWRARELLLFLTWRNVLIRYKQTALGVAWAVLQPVFLMLVFSLFFGRLANIPSEGVPYPIFAFTALLPWTFFSTSLTQSSNSLVGSANLISKIYFPRLTLPLAAVLATFIDLLLAFGVLLALMAGYGIAPSPWAALAVPGLILLGFTTALGVGLWLSALNVSYRDVQYVVPFLVQLWLFATPVVYPSSLLDEPWRTLFGVNPMAGVVEGFRWALVDGAHPRVEMIALSAGVALLLLASGAAYFRRMERVFADVV